MVLLIQTAVPQYQKTGLRSSFMTIGEAEGLYKKYLGERHVMLGEEGEDVCREFDSLNIKDSVKAGWDCELLDECFKMLYSDLDEVWKYHAFILVILSHKRVDMTAYAQKLLFEMDKMTVLDEKNRRLIIENMAGRTENFDDGGCRLIVEHTRVGELMRNVMEKLTECKHSDPDTQTAIDNYRKALAGCKRLTLSEAEKMYKDCGGEGYVMWHEYGKTRCRQFGDLNIPVSTKAKWDSELLEKHFRYLWTDPERVWYSFGDILNVLGHYYVKIDDYAPRLLDEMEKMSSLDDDNITDIIEYMAYRPNYLGPSGCEIFLDHSSFGRRMKDVMEKLISKKTDNTALKEAVRKYLQVLYEKNELE